MQRHWTINGRFLAQPGTGADRYAHEIVSALDHLLARDPGFAKDLEIEIVTPPDAPASLPLEMIRVRAVGRFGGHLWEQAVLPAHAPGGLLSLCSTGPVTHGRQILCIHDMNVCPGAEGHSLAFRSLCRVLLPALARNAAAVATVSDYSASEIARHGIRPRDEIEVIPGGHEHAARWLLSPADANGAASSDTIALLGSPASQQNLGLVLRLAERLQAEGLKIAVAGDADPRLTRGTSESANANVTWLGRLSDAELGTLLRDALCLACPSSTAGSDLPLIEAMALGCPIVASRRASIPEICDDAALYAAPDDPDTWFRHFLALRDSPELRQSLSERGKARAGLFRWQDSAERYLKLMARVDGRRYGNAA